MGEADVPEGVDQAVDGQRFRGVALVVCLGKLPLQYLEDDHGKEELCNNSLKKISDTFQIKLTNSRRKIIAMKFCSLDYYGKLCKSKMQFCFCKKL